MRLALRCEHDKPWYVWLVLGSQNRTPVHPQVSETGVQKTVKSCPSARWLAVRRRGSDASDDQTSLASKSPSTWSVEARPRFSHANRDEGSPKSSTVPARRSSFLERDGEIIDPAPSRPASNMPGPALLPYYHDLPFTHLATPQVLTARRAPARCYRPAARIMT